MKGERKYLVALLLTLGIAIYAEVSAPRPVDWSPSYSRYHKIPYGAFVLYELLADEHTGGDLVSSDRPIYNTLEERYDAEPASYVILNADFSPDEYDREALLEFVAEGNTLFLAAGRMNSEMMDSLGIELEENWLVGGGLEEYLLRDTMEMNLVSPSLHAASPWPLRVGRSGERWLTSFDTARSVVLGLDGKGRTNFIRISHGEGSIYLHTVPVAFTNHNVLVGRNAEYAFGALSYVPRGTVIWDEYYKMGREVTGSPVGVILRDAALKWAWLTALIGALLFILVFARRRQRAIPVVPPPANTTLEFATTVGRLYYEHGDHRGIASKKAAYFHEYLRSHLGLRIDDGETDLYRRVAERSGVSEDSVRTIFGRIQYMRRANEFGEEDLKGLNADLEEFYSNSKR